MIKQGSESYCKNHCDVITDETKKLWWFTYDPWLQKVYTNFIIRKREKRNSNGSQVINLRKFNKQNIKIVYPFIYQFCKQYRKQHNNNRFIPTKMIIKDGEQTIKKAAEISDPKLYFKIKMLILFQKSFVIILHHVIWSSLNVWGLRKNK